MTPEENLEINSRDYWNLRFKTNWNERGGNEQTTFFADVLIRNLPSWFVKQVRSERMSLCDWGCAEGVMVAALSQLFAGQSIVGVDFAEEAIHAARKMYPEFEFEATDWLKQGAVLPSYDVVITSNTLEHFKDPFKIVRKVLGKVAQKYIVILVPFEEEIARMEPEHFVRFLPETTPLFLDSWACVAYEVIDTAVLPSTRWRGQQALLVYANQSSKKRRTPAFFVADLRGKERLLAEQKQAAVASIDLAQTEAELAKKKLELQMLHDANLLRSLDQAQAREKNLLDQREKLQQQIQDLIERNQAISKIQEQLQAQSTSASNAVNEHQQENHRLRTQLEAQTKAYQELVAAHATLKHQNGSLIESTERLSALLQSDLEHQKQRLAQQERLAELNRELQIANDALEKASEAMHHSHDELEREFRLLKQEHERDIEVRHHVTKELETCRQEFEACRHGLEISKHELKTCEQELEISKHELKACEQELEVSKHELKACEQELEISKHKLKACEQELEISKHELESCRQELDKNNAEASQRKEELEAYNDENAKLQVALEEERSKLATASHQVKQLQSRAEQLWHSLREREAFIADRNKILYSPPKICSFYARAVARRVLLLSYRTRKISCPSPAGQEGSSSSISSAEGMTSTRIEEDVTGPASPESLSLDKDTNESPVPSARRCGSVSASILPTVAAILDPFSHACFAPECQLVTFSPENWRSVLEQSNPAFLLVESAWHGLSGEWNGRIASYSKPKGDELSEVILWCNRRSIPTVFWNKEDPPNYDRFIGAAKKFDYVFTTDANCISSYVLECGHDRVFPLPFAAQSSIHNPLLTEPRQEKICFAGTYYADCFEERRVAMENLLRASVPHGLIIYDRMFGNQNPDRLRFVFPDEFQPYIAGRLDYQDMLKAYRRFRVFLNVNSVQDSPTMFARRVFELLACGTPVVSTPSSGVRDMFGDLVPCAQSVEEAADALQPLMLNELHWMRTSAQGVREVMKQHTYTHRFAEVCGQVGLSHAQQCQKPLLIILGGGQRGRRCKDALAAGRGSK